MVWGTTGGDGNLIPEKFRHLPLECIGGGSLDGDISYYVWHSNYKYELTKKEFESLDIWFTKLRKEKLNKINNA